MNGLSQSELLFYGGITAMAVAVILAIAAIVIFRICGKRIQAQLEAEFGKKRH